MISPFNITNYDKCVSCHIKKVMIIVYLLTLGSINTVNCQNLIREGKTVNEVRTMPDGTKSALFTYVEEDERRILFKLNFISDDGDDKPESVKYITTDTIAREYRNKDGQIVKALMKRKSIFTCKALKTKIMHREDLFGKPYTYTNHILLGSEIKISHFYDRKNPEIFLGSKTAKIPNTVMNISEYLYNIIADTMGDNIQYINE